jgi:hypothetical protein
MPFRSRWATRLCGDVPEAAQSIVIGLVLAGNGVGWFGDLELESGLAQEHAARATPSRLLYPMSRYF